MGKPDHAPIQVFDLGHVIDELQFSSDRNPSRPRPECHWTTLKTRLSAIFALHFGG
jgi:hypothetical protein